MSRIPLWRVLPTLLLMACGNPAADLEPRRAMVLKKLEAFDAAGQAVQAEGPVRGDTLYVTGPAPSFPPGSGSPNAVVMSLDDFADLTTTSKKYRLIAVNPIQRIAAWARKSQTPWGQDLGRKEVDALQNDIPRFLQLKYVLVARTVQVVEPTLAGNGYFGGSFRADAILFDLDDRKPLGGVAFKGESDAKASVDQRDPVSSLKGILRKNTVLVLASAFKRHFPDVSPPADEPMR